MTTAEVQGTCDKHRMVTIHECPVCLWVQSEQHEASLDWYASEVGALRAEVERLRAELERERHDKHREVEELRAELRHEFNRAEAYAEALERCCHYTDDEHVCEIVRVALGTESPC